MARGEISNKLPISQPSRVGYQLRSTFPDPNRFLAVGSLILDSRKNPVPLGEGEDEENA
jgi:hypothetical protein